VLLCLRKRAPVRTWFLSWSLLLLKRGVHAAPPSTSVSASSTASCSGPSSSSSSFHSNVSSSPAGALSSSSSMMIRGSCCAGACSPHHGNVGLVPCNNTTVGSASKRCHACRGLSTTALSEWADANAACQYPRPSQRQPGLCNHTKTIKKMHNLAHQACAPSGASRLCSSQRPCCFKCGYLQQAVQPGANQHTQHKQTPVCCKETRCTPANVSCPTHQVRQK
jgi:hypothetical protein